MAPAGKKKILHRLAIAKGQLEGLSKMVAEDKYCVDVITLSSAIRQALSSVEDAMLENHLATHVVHQMQHGESAKAVKEMVKVFQLAKKK